jgi:hypothetical protein
MTGRMIVAATVAATLLGGVTTPAGAQWYNDPRWGAAGAGFGVGAYFAPPPFDGLSAGAAGVAGTAPLWGPAASAWARGMAQPQPLYQTTPAVPYGRCRAT